MTILKTVDVNCDVGELHTLTAKNIDQFIMPNISSCNIACGGHAGDEATMLHTIGLAVENKVAIGAHPSYLDQENFGRVTLKQSVEKTIEDCRAQIIQLKNLTESSGSKLNHIKPHGALYNDLSKDTKLSAAFIQLVKEIDPGLELYLMALSSAVIIAREAGLIVKEEVFADRNYDERIVLRNRNMPAALISDKAELIDKVSGYLRNELTLYNGLAIAIPVDTICIHSDTPQAVEFSEAIHTHLKKENVRLVAHK